MIADQCMLLFVQGFVLEFVFEPNDYFTNPILTKEYFIRFSVDEENPLGYEGPDIVKCAGYVFSLLFYYCCIFKFSLPPAEVKIIAFMTQAKSMVATAIHSTCHCSNCQSLAEPLRVDSCSSVCGS